MSTDDTIQLTFSEQSMLDALMDYWRDKYVGVTICQEER